MLLRHGGEVCRVERVGECNAVIRPLAAAHRVIVTCAGKKVEFDAPRALIRISTQVDASLILSAAEGRGK